MADIRAGDMMKKWQNENIDRRDELVKILDIDLDWKMHQVSDGQRKRVQIMLGLLKPFKFLIIDEFLNELDVVIRDRFFKYLTKECKMRNGAIIYATHVFDDFWIVVRHLYSSKTSKIYLLSFQYITFKFCKEESLISGLSVLIHSNLFRK